MRTVIVAAFAAFFVSASLVEAADVEFESGPTMFEPSADAHHGHARRITIEGQPILNSPLYEGLWQMTLEAFQPDDRILRPTPIALPHFPSSLVPQQIEESWQTVGRKIVCTGKCDCRSGIMTSVEFSYVNTYDSPLFEGLWPITLEMFRTADEEHFDEAVPGIVIAANDMQPLRNSLWKATREKFAEVEAVYNYGGLAFTR